MIVEEPPPLYISYVSPEQTPKGSTQGDTRTSRRQRQMNEKGNTHDRK